MTLTVWDWERGIVIAVRVVPVGVETHPFQARREHTMRNSQTTDCVEQSQDVNDDFLVVKEFVFASFHPVVKFLPMFSRVTSGLILLVYQRKIFQRLFLEQSGL
jgi:hypothetical protein